MRRVLFFDVETTGVDPQVDHVIEAAGVLWSVEHTAMVAAFSFVVRPDMPTVANPAERINRISPALLDRCGVTPATAWERIGAWFSRADAVVAYNAGFDRSFVERHVEHRPTWICALEDIDWPLAPGGGKLVEILLAHGLGVSHAHRALTDAMNIARLVERVAEMGTAPADLFARAMRPKKIYKALIPRSKNHLAKAAMFRWNPERTMWWRRIAPDDLDALQLPFGVVEVTDAPP